jgi:hypothetical protein
MQDNVADLEDRAAILKTFAAEFREETHEGFKHRNAGSDGSEFNIPGAVRGALSTFGLCSPDRNSSLWVRIRPASFIRQQSPTSNEWRFTSIVSARRLFRFDCKQEKKTAPDRCCSCLLWRLTRGLEHAVVFAVPAAEKNDRKKHFS